MVFNSASKQRTFICCYSDILNRMGHNTHFISTQSSNDDDQIGAHNGAVSLIYDREGNRKYLTVNERRAFLRATENMRLEVRTFCLVLAYTGARLSEVLALTPARFDFEAHVVIFESLKKRRRGLFRAVPIPSELLLQLDQVHYLQSDRKNFGTANRRIWTWGRTTAWTRVKEALAKAGIFGPMATPKGLRHAFAVASIQAGVPINFVRKWLGHSRLSTTEIYLDAVGDEERSIATRFWKTF